MPPQPFTNPDLNNPPPTTLPNHPSQPPAPTLIPSSISPPTPHPTLPTPILEPEDPSTTQTHHSSIPNSKANLKTPEQKQPEELDAEQEVHQDLEKIRLQVEKEVEEDYYKEEGIKEGKVTQKGILGDEEGVRSLEENKEVEVKFEKPHVDSAEYKRKMVRKGSDYVIKPRMKTIDDIIGWEYTVVFCQISFIDPHAAMLFSESFLYAVGVLFEKYNKDVVFLLVDIEEQMELFKTHGLQHYNALGFFDPFNKKASKVDDLMNVNPSVIESLDFHLDKILQDRKISSEEELLSSDVPLNKYYPNYVEKKKREAAAKFEFNIDFNSMIIKEMAELSQMNAKTQKMLKKLNKDISAEERKLISE